MRTVIIGAGQAGRRTAETLRDLDDAREILLIGEEPEGPYDRPPLSKEMLLGEEAPRGLMQRDAAAWEARRIALRTACRIAGLDLAAGRIETASGERIAFDALVLATGARARRLALPGMDSPRVVTLRSIADARALRERLRPGLRLAIAGAGLIGLEVAAAARRIGCAVTVLEAGDRVLARSVPDAIGSLVADWHRDAGVMLRLSCPLLEAVPRGDALRLVTGAGEVEADLLLIAVGGIANTELALEAGLAVEAGVLVDGCGRTSGAGVFAAGEVAAIHDAASGRHVRHETWQVAQHQPLAVAHALCGIERPYGEIPWHWTDQLGRNVQMLGAQAEVRDWVWRREAGGRLTAVGLDAAGCVRGGVTIDNGRDATPLRRLIASGRPPDRDRLADAAVPLRQLC